MPANPFLEDKGQALALALMSIGGGISQAANSGQGGLSGIGPGAMNFVSAMGQARQQKEMEDLRRWQISLQERALNDKRDERDRLDRAASGWMPPGMSAPAGPSTPGMRPGPNLPTMGPGGFTGQVGTDESANSYTAVNGKGSGAYGKYQFMPDTWASIAAKYPNLGLPTNMRQATPDQQEAAMRALVQENSDGLRRAGFAPTDENLYYAHRFGVNGAGTLLRSDGGAPVSSLFPAQWTAQNPDMAGVSVDQFKGRTQQRYSAQPPQAPSLQEIPRPQLPQEDAARLMQAVRSRAMTPQQAESEAHRIIDGLWNSQREMARSRFQQESENYRFARGQTAEQDRFNRGLETEGEWVRGADGVEVFVPKAGRSSGMRRYDKPKEAGTAEGDIAILSTGKPDTREYMAAYNRVRGRMIDGPNGIKYVPDMSAYAQPSFVEPNAAQPAPATGSPAAANAPPGLTPVEGEKKYTESQGKDHTYATRLDNSIPQLEAMVRGDDGKFSTSRLPSSYQRMKMNSQFVPDTMLSDDTKAFRRVANDIVTALLRRESGAAVPQSEYGPEYSKFIPQPGDSDTEIRAKLTALKKAARTFAEGTGRPLSTYKNLVDGGDAQVSGPASTAAPIRIDMSGKRQ